MLISLALLSVLAAAPSPRVVTGDVRFVGLSRSAAESLVERFTRSLSAAGVRVLPRPAGTDDKFASCGQDAECVGELTGALGVNGIVVGSITRADAGYALELRLVDDQGGSPASYSGQVASESSAREWLEARGKDLGEQLLFTGIPRERALLPALGGGVLAIAGFVAFHIANSYADQNPPTAGGLLHLAEVRDRLQLIGMGCSLAAVAGLASAALIYGLGKPSEAFHFQADSRGAWFGWSTSF